MAIRFVVCLDKQDLGDFSNADVHIGRLYELLDEEAGQGMVRIIDESGEDYLYPAAWFAPISLVDSAAHRLHDALLKLAA